MHFPIPLQFFLPIFYAVQHIFFTMGCTTHIYTQIFFSKKSQYYLSELHLKASSVDNLWGLSLYITTLLLRNYRFLGFFPILFPGTGEKESHSLNGTLSIHYIYFTKETFARNQLAALSFAPQQPVLRLHASFSPLLSVLQSSRVYRVW